MHYERTMYQSNGELENTLAVLLYASRSFGFIFFGLLFGVFFLAGLWLGILFRFGGGLLQDGPGSCGDLLGGGKLFIQVLREKLNDICHVDSLRHCDTGLISRDLVMFRTQCSTNETGVERSIFGPFLKGL